MATRAGTRVFLVLLVLSTSIAPIQGQGAPNPSPPTPSKAPQSWVAVWRPSGNPDPLRVSSPAFDAAQAALPEPGTWSFAFETSYFNDWGVSTDLAQLHGELGRERQPVGDDEIAELEWRDPGGSSFMVDLEGWRTDIVVASGLTARLGLTVQVPFVDVGTPHWDGIAESWHQTFSLPNGDRDIFPRSSTMLVLRGHHRSLVRRDLSGSGVGDVTVGLVADLGRAFGGQHRLVAVVKAPTGEQDTLRGSGGWDAGARWFGQWSGKHVDFLAGAGYSYLDRNGSLLSLTRADLWHLLAGLDWRLGGGLAATLRSSWERSPLDGALDERPAHPGWFTRFGLAADLGHDLWLAVDTGQDSPSGLAPDYTFHLTFGFGKAR